METALYKDSGSLLKDAQGIIEQARQEAYRSVNIAMLQRNWLLGKRISEEILRGENRAEYGNEVIKKLSEELTDIYGKGFNKNNLYAFVQFYKLNSTHKCNLSVRPFVMVAKLAKKYSRGVRKPSFFLGLLFNLF